MSDLEKMKAFFKDMGIVFEEITSMQESNEQVSTMDYAFLVSWDTLLKLDNGAGYWSSYCEFYFLEGKYQNHGCWE